MSSPFGDLAREALGQVLEVFADREGFHYEPMLRAPGGGRPIADPARPPLPLPYPSAALTAKPVMVQPTAPHEPRDTVPKASGQALRFTLIDTTLPYLPARGDRITRLSDGSVYEVQAILDTDPARLTLEVFKRAAGERLENLT